MSSTWVFQIPGTECVIARKFGFQQQTNYPFRKTSMKPYDKSSEYSYMSSNQQGGEMMPDRAVVSKFVSNRVPVDGLSSASLSL